MTAPRSTHGNQLCPVSTHVGALHCEREDQVRSQKKVSRSPSETRVLALRLLENPPPDFSKVQLEARWQLGPDTVRKILRIHGVDPGLKKGLVVPFHDVLLCEGFTDPLGFWAVATAHIRAILRSDLLTMDEWKAAQPRDQRLHSDGLNRQEQNRLLRSIRMGKFYRFRRNARQAQEWLSEKGGQIT